MGCKQILLCFAFMSFECGWERYNTVEEAGAVEVGSNLCSEVPVEGGGKGIL